ncbi:MAG: Coenzyme F420 hydrogenase/dehydrogenase, beta subunit C-terminal domain [Henriciella sp.]|nr:Coenzyme F420 hydrogenase/dehydrogenase, beta subunit C-terminal domain [Henriciella sp.]
MRRNDRQSLVAALPENATPSREAELSCPFTDESADEESLSQERFTAADIQRDKRIGAYLGTYAGWVEEGEFRAKGSSGGMGAWILSELLERDLVDAVIHVAELERDDDPTSDEIPMFGFRVSTNAGDVKAHAKSRYYPVQMSDVIKHMIETPGRYAVVGVPCFCTALRLVAKQSEIVSERLAFVVGIVCGHLKSGAFAEALAWQCGIAPEGLQSVDFRVKLEGRPASRYGLRADGIVNGEPKSVTAPMEGLIGANWGHGLFKLKACEFCDDVLAETADIVVGDAWLPQYDDDYRGTNVVVVRDATLHTIVKDAARKGRLHLEDLSADEVAASQAGGLRHRRDGLAYRLLLADERGDWRPRKRVLANAAQLTKKLQRIHRKRYALGQASHDAFLKAKQAGNFVIFEQEMAPLLKSYDREHSRSLLRRAAGRVKRMLLG